MFTELYPWPSTVPSALSWARQAQSSPATCGTGVTAIRDDHGMTGRVRERVLEIPITACFLFLMTEPGGNRA